MKQTQIDEFRKNFKFLAITQFEVGNGWAKLLHDFFVSLDNLPEGFLVTRVSRVYGKVMISAFEPPNNWFDLTMTLATESSRWCEFCGQPGEIRATKWRYTTCEKHK